MIRNKNDKVLVSIKARNRLMSKSTSVKGRIIGIVLYFFLFMYTFIIFFGEILFLPNDEKAWCAAAQLGYPGIHDMHVNPDYDTNPCVYERTIYLLFINKDECDMARRMLFSVIFGATIGFERKTNERPVGIRTMSLVCLGACFFTISSYRGFRSSSMGWDAARVSAAIPSGVGFLGAALIWKGTKGTKGSPDERHEVHGLTTAAGVWLSAAIGVGTGGRLIVVSAYAVALVIIVLRLGPRLYFSEDHSSFLSDMYDEESDHYLSSTEDDVDLDEFDTDALHVEEKARLLSQEQQNVFMATPVIPEDRDVISKRFTYEQNLRLPKAGTVRLRPRDKKVRSLSPRTLMRSRGPTFHS